MPETNNVLKQDLDLVERCREVFFEALVAALHLELEVVHVRLHLREPAQEVRHALVEAETTDQTVLTSHSILVFLSWGGGLHSTVGSALASYPVALGLILGIAEIY